MSMMSFAHVSKASAFEEAINFIDARFRECPGPDPVRARIHQILTTDDEERRFFPNLSDDDFLRMHCPKEVAEQLLRAKKEMNGKAVLIYRVAALKN